MAPDLGRGLHFPKGLWRITAIAWAAQIFFGLRTVAKGVETLIQLDGELGREPLPAPSCQ
jgi:hypothetical protein